MRQTIQVKGLGEVHIRAPRSFVTINDLVSEYTGNQSNRAKLARLCAAIICACWSEDNEQGAPVYDVASGDVIAFGGESLEWMIRKKVDLGEMYTAARPLFIELWEELPKEKEVSQKADSFLESGELGSTGAENSKGVAQSA